MQSQLLVFVTLIDGDTSIWLTGTSDHELSIKDTGQSLERGILFHTFSLSSPEDHTEQKVKNIFEADIQLTKSDSEGVDTKNYDSDDTANVDVDSVVSKRKAISSRRHLWVTKEVPVELETTASKMSQNVVFFQFYN